MEEKVLTHGISSLKKKQKNRILVIRTLMVKAFLLTLTMDSQKFRETITT